VNLNEKLEKLGKHSVVIPSTIPDRDKPPPKKSKFGWSWKLSSSPPAANTDGILKGDAEKGTVPKDPRPIRLFAPFYGGVGAAFSVCECHEVVFLVKKNLI
jgi:hypothetical protein